MKALFKLKETPYIYENMLSNEKAEEYYKKGSLPFNVGGWGFGAVRVSCGFYSQHLTFAEWVDRYRLKII
jgi:hypothetical protein